MIRRGVSVAGRAFALYFIEGLCKDGAVQHLTDTLYQLDAQTVTEPSDITAICLRGGVCDIRLRRGGGRAAVRYDAASVRRGRRVRLRRLPRLPAQEYHRARKRQGAARSARRIHRDADKQHGADTAPYPRRTAYGRVSPCRARLPHRRRDLLHGRDGRSGLRAKTAISDRFGRRRFADDGRAVARGVPDKEKVVRSVPEDTVHGAPGLRRRAYPRWGASP